MMARLSQAHGLEDIEDFMQLLEEMGENAGDSGIGRYFRALHRFLEQRGLVNVIDSSL